MTKALLIVDVQNDFLPGGALAVAYSDQILPVINKLIDQFDYVFATKDYHPKNHISFASRWQKSVGFKIKMGVIEQVLWPDHCVAGEWGSQLSDKLNKKKIKLEFIKGTQSEIDSYSIFFDQNHNPASEIDRYFKKREISDLYIVGLTTDYCVKQTALDALSLGYNVFIVVDGCKAVNIHKSDGTTALNEMQKKGAHLIYSDELIKQSHLKVQKRTK